MNAPAARPCCILNPSVFVHDNVVDPDALGEHGQGVFTSERNGLIYTRKAGFFDLGHARDNADLTHYLYQQLLAARPTRTVRYRCEDTTVSGVFEIVRRVQVETRFGSATVDTLCKTHEQLLDAAARIAYAESVAYEVYTYFESGPGEHNSSFSPEDLPSNAFGICLAREAIRREEAGGPPFAQGFTEVLRAFLVQMEAVSAAETRAALRAIAGRWTTGDSSTEFMDDGFLLRRNFSGNQVWLVDGRAAPGGGRGADLTLTDQAAYTFRHGGLVISHLDLADRVAAVRADALGRYGAGSDAPGAVGRVAPRPAVRIAGSAPNEARPSRRLAGGPLRGPFPRPFPELAH